MSNARHAGFASVTTVGAEFVNEMLAGATTLVPPTNFSLPSIVTVGGDSIGLIGTLSLDAPTVSFAANSQNLIGVTIGASGTVRLTANGNDLVEVDATLTTSLLVGLFVNVSPASLAFGVDLSNASVTAVDVQVKFGPPLATQYMAALQSGPVLSALSSALRSIPKAALTFTVPGVRGTLSYTFSGVTVTVAVSNVVVVPLDGNVGSWPTAVGGCIDIALDVAPYTSGDASQLVNLITTPGPIGAGFSVDQFGNEGFAGDGYGSHNSSGTNLATIVNADFFTSLVNGQIAPQISGMTVQHVTINSLSISFGTVTAALDSQLPTLQYNCLSASVTGAFSGIGFSFNASFTPVSVEIDQPYHISYSMWMVAYDFSSPLLTILDIFLPILFPWLGVIGDMILNSTIDSFVANAANSLSGGMDLNGVGSLPIPGVNGWNLQYWVDDMAVSTSEISGYMALKAAGPPSPAAVPIFTLTSQPHALTDPSPIPVTLLVTRAGLMDPILGLRLSWTVVRADTGATVLSQDTPLATASLTIEIDRWSGDLTYNNTWNVTCEVYRPADALTSRYTYFSQSISTGVSDLVDRHHPYVRWDHMAWFHNPSGVGTLKQHGFWTRHRKSRIHRTDLLIRCKALQAAFSSGYPQETGKGLVELKERVPTPQYLDSIATYGSFEDVECWRHGVLCDYCFFGGPTRTTWKVPTHPTPSFS